MSFYNTTSEAGATLRRAHKRADTQQEYILKLIYQCDPANEGFTTDEIYTIVRRRKMKAFRFELEKMYSEQKPFQQIFEYTEAHYVGLSHALGSIRRSCTDLTNTDPPFLEMTEKKRIGTSGRNNMVYKRIK